MKINLLIALAGMVLVIGQSNCLTPLMDAVLKNNLSEVKKLIKSGVKVNEKDDYGTTALYAAADGASVDIAKILIKHRADVKAKDKDGCTPIITASMVSSAAFTHDQAEKQKRFDDAAKVVKLLIDKGADVNVKDAYVGATALMHASMIGAIPVAKILIAKGADIKAKDKFGNTALDYAKKAKQTEMVKFLEEKMAASGSRAE